MTLYRIDTIVLSLNFNGGTKYERYSGKFLYRSIEAAQEVVKDNEEYRDNNNPDPERTEYYEIVSMTLIDD